MYWLIGFLVIIGLAAIIVKILANTNKNNDSKLGILEHPSVFKKQGIEMVEDNSAEQVKGKDLKL